MAKRDIEYINIRALGPGILRNIDKWRLGQVPVMSRASAMRFLVRMALIYEKADRNNWAKLMENHDLVVKRAWARVMRDEEEAKTVAQTDHTTTASLIE
jgi:hypothetical protein